MKPRTDPAFDFGELVRRVNRRHGTAFELVLTFEVGVFGAAELVDAQGNRFVLKQAHSHRAAEASDILRELGYPTPRYIVVGRGYCIQEKLPGVPLQTRHRLPEGVAERLIELNELQARQAPQSRRWRSSLRSAALAGMRRRDARLIRRHSARSARLIERCERAVRLGADRVPPPVDIQHSDFNPRNVLVELGRVVGVVDWENVRAGDRLFDLASMLFYSRQPEPFRSYLVQEAGERLLAAYLAHVFVHHAAWSIRSFGPEAGEELVEWCTALLDGLASS